MRGCALAASLLAAATLPGERLGVAVPVVAALMLATGAAAFRVSLLRIVFGGLALALAAQAALLDATWVVLLDLAAAWVLASLAASGVSVEALVAPFSRLRDAPALAPRPTERHAPVMRGLVLGAVLVLPFLLLFLDADAAFAGIAGDLPMPSVDGLPGRVAVLAVVLAATLGLGLAARRPPAGGVSLHRGSLSFAEWAIALALLDLLFLAFVAVQFAVLFGGHDRVLQTAGLTYAEYARSGFWQLLAATGLTFAVVGSAMTLARVSDARQRLVLRLLLGILCAATLVVLVSALHRLRLYEDAFGLTRSRLLAESVAFWLGLLLLLVAAAVWHQAVSARIARAALLLSAAGLLAFSVADPDSRVAARNVDHWRATGHIDLGYLAGLSADAVPALLELPAGERETATASIRRRIATGDPLGSANRSRARARKLLS